VHRIAIPHDPHNCQTTHPDAALLRLGQEFERLHAEWLPLDAESTRCHDLFERLLSIEACRAEWERLSEETGRCRLGRRIIIARECNEISCR
jgi:hypothetical protein